MQITFDIQMNSTLIGEFLVARYIISAMLVAINTEKVFHKYDIIISLWLYHQHGRRTNNVFWISRNGLPTSNKGKERGRY